MFDKIKDQRLITLIIIIFLTMQFVLTYTGHKQIDADVLNVRASLETCQSMVSRPH